MIGKNWTRYDHVMNAFMGTVVVIVGAAAVASVGAVVYVIVRAIF